MALKSATLYLWIYSGNFDGGNKDVNNATYVLYKEVQGSATTIDFEIAELVSDYIEINFNGGVVELVYARDLKSLVFGHEGSSPSIATKQRDINSDG